MEVKAKLNNLRIAPRKVRLVINLVKSLNVVKAEEQLTFLKKAAAPVILKLLNSAVANAVNNYKLSKENLYIKTIFVDQGVTLKRWAPRAMGRATPIRKRSAHVTMVLAEKELIKKTIKKTDKKIENKKEKPTK